jgi:asparagine synthase (glutamine-hydrolysing)
MVEDERLAPLELYARSVSVVPRAERDALYAPDTLAILGETRPWSALAALFGDAVSGGAEDTLDAIHYVELTLRLPARAAAASAACAGLDLRLPLADHRLAQFVASVPARQRGSARERQLLLRAALGDMLAPALGRRPHGTTMPTARAWAAIVDDALAPSRVAAQGFFRPETVTRLRDEHASGRRDRSALLWSLVLASRWLERQPVPTPVAVREAG